MKKQKNRLTRGDSFTLAKYLDQHKQEFNNRAPDEVAKRVSDGIGFQVNPSQIISIIEDASLDISLFRKPKGVSAPGTKQCNRQKMMAGVLLKILKELNEASVDIDLHESTIRALKDTAGDSYQ